MSIEASRNFRRINDRLTTSGTVQVDDLRMLRAEGYEAVVNLLPDTSEYAVSNERNVVESQGIEYVHIPVDFKQPTEANFSQFSAALDRLQQRKVHLHCAANYRVSAFCSLYFVSRGVWSTEQSAEFIASIWQLSEYPAWSQFIASVLSRLAAARR